jgi:hypothetical protein
VVWSAWAVTGAAAEAICVGTTASALACVDAAWVALASVEVPAVELPAAELLWAELLGAELVCSEPVWAVLPWEVAASAGAAVLAVAGAAADAVSVFAAADCGASIADFAGSAVVVDVLLAVWLAVRSVGAAVAVASVEAGAAAVVAVSLAFVAAVTSAAGAVVVPAVVAELALAASVAAAGVMRDPVSADTADDADVLVASVLLLAVLSVLPAGLASAAACFSLDLISVVAAATVIGFTVAALLLLVAGSSSVDLFAFLLLEIGFCFVPLGCFRCGAAALPLPTTSEKGVKPGATDGACCVAAGKLPGVKLAFGLLVG